MSVRHRQSKEASILWSHNEETRKLPGERENARNNARCMQARKATTAWMDNIKMWTELSMEESVRMTEDRDKWRKYVHSPRCVQPCRGSRTAKEQMSDVVLV